MSKTKDQLAEMINSLFPEQMKSALQFLVGNDVRATEDAVSYAIRTTPPEERPEPTTNDYLSDILEIQRAIETTLNAISDCLYRLTDHLGG